MYFKSFFFAGTKTQTRHICNQQFNQKHISWLYQSYVPLISMQFSHCQYNCHFTFYIFVLLMVYINYQE